jgi:DNA-directed RNA polymerase specialized sigma24 family protein
MYYREGLQQIEIAARLGVFQSTVSRTLERGRVRLRRAGVDVNRMGIRALEDLAVLVDFRNE